MRLNKNELRKIMYEFNSLSNRLLQANFHDYNGVLTKFVKYIDQADIIREYISDCGECIWDMKQEIENVQSSRTPFPLGETDAEEVCNVYAILKYIVKNNINICMFGMVYSYSTKFQEMVKDFNDRVTMVLIRHVEVYLSGIGIDMGVDNRVTYNITVKDGQVNIANDNASIAATNTVDINEKDIVMLIDNVRKAAEESKLSDDDNDTLNSSLEVINEEIKTKNPRKTFLKTALTGIKAIKGTTEFGTAVIALAQFIQPFIS